MSDETKKPDEGKEPGITPASGDPARSVAERIENLFNQAEADEIFGDDGVVESGNELVASAEPDDNAEDTTDLAETEPPAEPEKEDEPVEEPVKEEPRKAEPAPEPEPEPVATEGIQATDKDSIIQSLRSEIERLAGLQKQQDKPVTEPQAKPSESSAQPQPAQPQPQEQPKDPELLNLVSEEEYDNVFSSKDELNKLLNKVFYYGQQASLRQVAPIVQNQVEQKILLTMKAKEFYERNPALNEYRNFVAACMQEIASDNPQMDWDTLFNETEKQAYQKLGITRDGTSAKTKPAGLEGKKAPAVFPRTQSPRTANAGKAITDRERKWQEIGETLGYE